MTGSKRRARSRRGRFAVLGALAAIAAMAFGASSAQATSQTFNATFDDAALNVSGLTFDILDPPNTATMTGTVNDAGGAVNVPANQFVVPQFSGDALPGVPVTVNLTAVDPIVGTLDLATGGMTTTLSTYHAHVVALGGDCNYDVDLAFNTSPGSPFNGDPFTVNGTGPISITNGALQTSWPAHYFTADPGTGCGTINGLVDGPGGLAFANGIDLTPTPPASGATPPPATAPKKKKCKKGFKLKKVHGKKKCVKKKKKK